MDEDKLVSIWKSNNITLSNEEDINILKSKNQVMESIIKFETTEKKEKKKQIIAAMACLVLLPICLIGITVTPLHLAGILMVFAGIAFAIISNQTDNFPDIKQLNTLEYLESFKKNTINRSKMHWRNTIISTILVVPGLYLMLKVPYKSEYWILAVIVVSMILSIVPWFRNYNKRSKEVINKVDDLLLEFK